MELSDDLRERATTALTQHLATSGDWSKATPAMVDIVYPIIRDALVNEMMSKEYLVANDVKARIRAETIEEVARYLRTTDQGGYIGPGFKSVIADEIEREFK